MRRARIRNWQTQQGAPCISAFCKPAILRTPWRPNFADYGDIFTRLLDGYDFTFSIFRVVDMEFPESIRACDGWLITGSRHGAYEDHPWIAPLEAFIRDCYAQRIPLVGICFGHQIIAQALGGKVEKFKGGWSVGRKTYRFEDLGDVAVNAWHQDQVTEKPTDARVIASSDFCANAALVYDDRALTIQPHPEFDADFIDGLIRTRGRGVVPDHRLDAASAQLDAPLDTRKMSDRIAAFFKQPRDTTHA